MQLETRLIALYSLIEDCYNNELRWYCQRFSPNGAGPAFTDIEVLTCYFFPLLEERKDRTKQMHVYMVKYWKGWFPQLPSYQAFNNRLNRMGDALGILAGSLCLRLQGAGQGPAGDYLVDSLPIMLAKGKRVAKVAPDLTGKTYSSSKGIWYWGLKLHLLGRAMAEGLPLPIYMGLSPANEHDLPFLEGISHRFRDCRIFGDKAYLSGPLSELFAGQDVELLCPEKKKKGETPWERGFCHAYRKAYGRAVSSVRQPIESFFNWLIEKANIQDASKVRSRKGLMVHAYGKIAAVMMILIGL